MSAISDFAELTAQHLSGWSVRPVTEDSLNPNHWQYLDGPGGASLTLRLNEREGKVEVIPSYPRKGGHTYPNRYKYSHEAARPGSINVALTRAALLAAKDITRRVIDPYLPVFAAGKAELAEDDAYDARKRGAVLDLAEYLNDDPPPDGSDNLSRYVMFPGSGGPPTKDNTIHVELQVNSPDSVQVKIRGLTPEQVKVLLADFPKLEKGRRTW